MRKFVQQPLLFLIVLFIQCAMLLSVVHSSSHIGPHPTASSEAGQSVSDVPVAHDSHKKDDTQTKQPLKSQGLVADACVGHHHCTTKAMVPMVFTLVRVSVSSSLSVDYINQHIPINNINSLDRPPKAIV